MCQSLDRPEAAPRSSHRPSLISSTSSAAEMSGKPWGKPWWSSEEMWVWTPRCLTYWQVDWQSYTIPIGYIIWHGMLARYHNTHQIQMLVVIVARKRCQQSICRKFVGQCSLHLFQVSTSFFFAVGDVKLTIFHLTRNIWPAISIFNLRG